MAGPTFIRLAWVVGTAAAVLACDDVPLRVSTTRLPPAAQDAATPPDARCAEDPGSLPLDAGSCPSEDPGQPEGALLAPLPFECGERPPQDAALVAVAHAEPVNECGGPEPERNLCGDRPRLQALVSAMIRPCAAFADGTPLHCTRLMLGVRRGVVVDITITPDATAESPSYYECLRAHLIGQRFSCAPSEVWTFGTSGICGPIPS